MPEQLYWGHLARGFDKMAAGSAHVRTSSSVGVLGWIRDERNPLDSVNIHHSRSMHLRFIPSIRKIFMVKAGSAAPARRSAPKVLDAKPNISRPKRSLTLVHK